MHAFTRSLGFPPLGSCRQAHRVMTNKISMLLDYGHGSSNKGSVGRVGVALVAASSRGYDSGRMLMAIDGLGEGAECGW